MTLVAVHIPIGAGFVRDLPALQALAVSGLDGWAAQAGWARRGAVSFTVTEGPLFDPDTGAYLGQSFTMRAEAEAEPAVEWHRPA